MSRILTICGGVMAAALLAGCFSPAGPSRFARMIPYRPNARPQDLPAKSRPAAEARQAPSPAATPMAVASETGQGVVTLKPLKPGDKITVSLRVYPQPETFPTVVDEEGAVNLPLINSIRIAGMTKSEAEKAIQKAYIDGGFYRSITVIIVPPDVKYYVMGEVKHPDSFPWVPGLRFLSALSEAGGYTEYANPSRVRVIRGADVFYLDARKIEEGSEKDQEVQAGDQIVVLRKWY
jgi:polysaccharide biosynthesis/export protein VpsN